VKDVKNPESPEGSFVEMKVLSRRYHLHWPGVIFILTTVLLALGAIQTQNNVLYIGFGLAVGAVLFSGIASGAMLMGVRISREVEHATGVDMPLIVRYRVRNSNRIFPAFALIIEEEKKIRKRANTTWKDRVQGTLLGTCVVSLRAGATAIVQGEAMAKSRGLATFDCVRVWTTFPFGIARKSVLFSPVGDRTQSTLVRPRVLRLQRKAMQSILSSDLWSGSSSRRTGGREEFIGIRPYAPHDSQSAIAWKPSARTLVASDELVVRENASMSGRKVWIEIDRSVEDLDKAAELAASVAVSAISAGAAAGLRLPHAVFSPVASVRHIGPMLDGLSLLTRDALNRECPPPRGRALRLRIGGAQSGTNLTISDLERLSESEGSSP
jgi:uncharacterized protein (DUF58 family)